MQRVGVALGAVTWARGLLQDPALAWDMTQYLQGQNCCHVLLLAGTPLAAAAQAASILCLASCRVWSWLLPSSKDSGSLSQSRQDCLQGTVSHRGLYAAVHKQRESSPIAEPGMAIQTHSALGSKLPNSDWDSFRGNILGLLVGDFWDKDNNNASNTNTDLLKEIILLGWQESKKDQSCHC